MGQWYEQPHDLHPEDSGELPVTAAKRTWLFWAVLGAIWAALILIAVLLSSTRS